MPKYFEVYLAVNVKYSVSLLLYFLILNNQKGSTAKQRTRSGSTYAPAPLA